MPKESRLSSPVVSRRQAVLGLGVVAGVGALGLAGCNSNSAAPQGSSSGSSDADKAVEIDTAAYDKIISSGPVADEQAIASSTWAQAVKKAGELKVGGVQTSTLFCLLNEKDGKVYGFDAGLIQMLARYITGNEDSFKLTQVTSDTRESVLTNGQVDAVFATYSITEDRKKVISFAGPYFTTQQAILVKASSSGISSVDDLDGKTVAAQSGSTGPSVLEEMVPKATVQEFKTDEEARAALEQGRVDAYVIDQTVLMSDMVKRPGAYKLAGEPFGPMDEYGIGMPLDSDGVAFVNTFLSTLESSGAWADLWKVCIGDRADIDTVPEPPAIQA